MEEDTTSNEEALSKNEEPITRIIGMDIGDKYSQLHVLDEHGEFLEETRLATTNAGVQRYFCRLDRVRVALEVGTHSRWLYRLLVEMGHEVLVANPRKLRVIFENDKKNDRSDAQILAEVAFMKPSLLRPIQHRGEPAQAALAVIRARDALVRARTLLSNHVRVAVKIVGSRLPGSSTASFHKLSDQLPQQRQEALEPLMRVVEALTVELRGYDKQIEKLAETSFPDSAVLRQVPGVGPLTSVAYVATLEEPNRFPSSRKVGSFLGLRPRQDQSGMIDRQLRITKAGDSYLRRLLVGSAQYILGPFGPDTDLRRWGLDLAKRGGKNAKKRAVVAVARKLAVLLLVLWKSQAKYEPLRGGSAVAAGDGLAGAAPSGDAPQVAQVVSR